MLRIFYSFIRGNREDTWIKRIREQRFQKCGDIIGYRISLPNYEKKNEYIDNIMGNPKRYGLL